MFLYHIESQPALTEAVSPSAPDHRGLPRALTLRSCQWLPTQLAERLQQWRSIVDATPPVAPGPAHLRDIQHGFALSLAFLVGTTFLYVRPEYLASPALSLLVGTVLGLFGAIGFFIELNKLSGRHDLGLDNVGVGIALLVIWAVTYLKLPHHPVLNFVLLFVLLFGLYGVFRGLIQATVQIFYIGQSPRAFASKVVVGIPLAISAALGLVQLLQLLGLIERH